MTTVINPTSLAEVARMTRPLSLARDRMVPVLPALGGLFPDGGLALGTTVGIGAAGGAGSGSTSLALALAAGPSVDGSWVAVVGPPDLGLAAAAEVGVDLDRLALVAEPPADGWAAVVAALIGAVGVVLVTPHHRVGSVDARRLAARARERGTILIQVGAQGLAVDLHLTVVDSEWQGVGSGHGYLRTRRLTVEAGGRRRASLPRRVDLWMPDRQGSVSVCGPDPNRLTRPLRQVG